jgi:hypothetical protein
MRIQSLRCNALYNHSATRLSVTPIHASRSQAIRFVLLLADCCLHLSVYLATTQAVQLLDCIALLFYP